MRQLDNSAFKLVGLDCLSGREEGRTRSRARRYRRSQGIASPWRSAPTWCGSITASARVSAPPRRGSQRGAVTYESIRQGRLKFGRSMADAIRRRQDGPEPFSVRMRGSCRATGSVITCGRPSLRRAASWIAGTDEKKRERRRVSSRHCRRDSAPYRANSAPTGSAAMPWSTGRNCPSSGPFGTRSNSGAEHFHQVTRPRERQMRRCKSADPMQRVLSLHGPINSFFRAVLHLMNAKPYRTLRERAFRLWDEVIRAQVAV